MADARRRAGRRRRRSGRGAGSGHPRAVPLASIVIVTYNNLALNRQCLESIFAATDWPNFEVITVDNASRDGTPEWLTRQAAQEPRLHVFLNAENRGYAGGNNQGLQAAPGEYLCLLNNDTLVTHGWLSTLIGHLRRMPPVGLIGPVSNMVGNEAKIPVGYRSIADMPRWAAAYCRDHDGETMAMPTLAFFCVLLRREVYATVGPLDSRFGLGFFEDDDYCRRAAEHGYQLCTARDALCTTGRGLRLACSARPLRPTFSTSTSGSSRRNGPRNGRPRGKERGSRESGSDDGVGSRE